MFKLSLVAILLSYASSTIDLNEEELKYLSNHLTGEECRKLVASAHFESLDTPNDLDQAEHKLSKDISCLDLLKHWNKHEGKGKTHEVLQLRLRQMGKYKLADWLGKTVFKELGKDLEKSLEDGFKDFLNQTSTTEAVENFGPTFVPVIKDSDPTTWTAMDSILFVTIFVLLFIFKSVCCFLCFTFIKDKFRKHKRKDHKATYQKLYENMSDTDSEEKFDVRNYVKKKPNLT